MAQPYERELHLAISAVQRASLLTKRFLTILDKEKGTVTKADATPVTIVDLAAQALLIAAIHHVFPADGFVGEEDSSALREDAELREKVWELVQSAQDSDAHESGERLCLPTNHSEMLSLIDLGGTGTGGPKGRTWMLDPIDGTRTYLKGQQWAVCLALVEDGQEKLGVLGCPNLPFGTSRVAENSTDAQGTGSLLFALKGQGAHVTPLHKASLAAAKRLEPWDVTTTQDLALVEDTTATSINLSQHRTVAHALNIPYPGTDLFSQQMKYVALALGAGDVHLRLPLKLGHRTACWDHAGGHLIVTEAGFAVTDSFGQPIDFGKGRRLYGNHGVVVARRGVHGEVLRVVREVRKLEPHEVFRDENEGNY